MAGYTPQERITTLYIALGLGILALVIVAIVLILAPAEARRRAVLPMAGFACLMGGLVAMAIVQLIGIRAGVDTTVFSLVIEFAGICLAGVIMVAIWITRRRARGREGRR